LLTKVDSDAILQDQNAHATRLSMLTTNVRTAQSTNLLTKVPLLVTQFKLVPTTTQSEVPFKTATDANHAQMDN